VGSADADVVQAAVDAQGDLAVAVDAVVADPVVALRNLANCPKPTLTWSNAR
jgi:hypothetical protein